MLIYLLKFSACLSIFLVFYKLVLERESMHHLKRYFLLAALILAFGIPLITFTQYVKPIIANTVSPSFDNFDNFSEITTAPIEVDYTPLILWTIYGVGVLLFGIKFLWNLSNIYYKIQHNPKEKNHSFINVLLKDFILPHTFFSYIFLNRQKFETKQIPQEVFWHEQEHAKQKHSLDVLFIELLQVVFWFNPLVYLAKHAIKLNHEFLADEAVLKHGIEPSNYQQLLLTYSSNVPEPKLANAINYSSIKKRFTVMKTHTSKQNIWIRSLLLLPLVALTLYGFSETQIIEKEIPIETALLDAIDLYLNEKGELLHNEKVITLQEIKELYKQNNDLYISITAFPNVNSEIVKNTVKQVKEIGFKKMTYCTSGDTKQPTPYATRQEMLKSFSKLQQKATPEQVDEYNKIVNELNSMFEKNHIIKLKDFNRIEYIYGLMTMDQKKEAQSFPKIYSLPFPEMTLDQKGTVYINGFVFKYETKDGETTYYDSTGHAFTEVEFKTLVSKWEADEREQEKIIKQVYEQLKNKIEDQKKDSELKDFIITVEKNEKEIYLKCTKGCAWTNLNLSLPENGMMSINQFGTGNINEKSTVIDSNLADFILIIANSEDGINLKGIKGTAWTDLNFSLPKNKKQAIDQFGMTN